jgi:hypothetical protein
MNIETKETIPHLDRSYRNVQEFMRFMDTKAGAVFTVAGLLLGWVAANPQPSFLWAKCFAAAGAIGVIAAMLFALRVVWPSHGPDNPERLTLLFPALHPKAKNEDGSDPNVFDLLMAKTAEPLSEKFVVDEFAKQLAHLHAPIVRKISFLRYSIQSLGFAIVCLGICLIGRVSGDPEPTAQTYEIRAQVSHQTVEPQSDAGDDQAKEAVQNSNSEAKAKMPPESVPILRAPR